MTWNGIMKTIIITLAVALFAGSTATAQEYERTIRESYKTTGSPEVVVDSRFGSVDVYTGSGSTVDAVVTVNVAAESKEEARKIAEKVRVEVKGNSKLVTVRTALPGGMDEEDGAERNITIDVNLSVPAKSRVAVDSKFGDVDVNGVRGSVAVECDFGSAEIKKCSNVRAQFSFGDLSLGAIEGSLAAEGKMGQIIAYDIPGGEISSSYGDVEINGVKGSLDLTSSMGSLTVKGMKNGTITNSYGSVDITLPSSFSGRIEASSSFGSVDSEVELKSEKKKRSPGDMGDKKFGSVGSGSDRLVIKTSFGDVNIEKE